MKYAPYIKQEKYIAASDAGSIIERWRYGFQLLDDANATTPAGNLRHGVLATLIGRATQRGYKISEREIRRRLECARAYRTEAEIGRAAADFEYWWNLVEAGFPAVEMPAEDSPEAEQSAAPEDVPDGPAEQLGLFPAEQFTRASTLGEMSKYADEQAEYTGHMAARDSRRAFYLGQLIAAVGGDLNATWEQAQAALGAAP